MIKNLSVLIIAALLMGCSTPSNEQTNDNESQKSIPLVKAEGSFIPEDIRSNVTSKRRGKLKGLKSDGEAWYSFQVVAPFENLKIVITNSRGVTDFIWPIEDIISNLDSLNTVQNIKVDMVFTEESVLVFFGESIRFSFEENLLAADTRIEVYTDGEFRDIPGVLYDVGG
ncbi:hypothetical protein [Ekhidna sp.]|uniref:hypothetical protein n=1 Tax=Ekhidna sp. TaxID=2608089 RepID=UPI0032998F6F